MACHQTGTRTPILFEVIWSELRLSIKETFSYLKSNIESSNDHSDKDNEKNPFP